MSPPEVAPLPHNAVLLHVGPHKTGTTTLQGAFHAARDRLTERGIHYAGANRQPMLAALSLTGRGGRRGDPKSTDRHWRDLVDEVRSHPGGRVVVSSEFLADTTPEQAARAIADLGGPRVHVVVTVRPLSRLMPSQWQQYVQNGLRTRYPRWLLSMLDNPPYQKPTPSFWNRHDHGRQVQKWVDAVGDPQRVTVVAVDEQDRRMLLDSFESLLGLPAGTLVPEEGIHNRSLTLGEVEVVRLLNEEFRRREWSDDLYGRFVRAGVAKKMIAQHVPGSDDTLISTPRWAAERAAERGAEAAAAIAASGVRVIGDLSSLGKVPDRGITDTPLPKDPLLPASDAAIAIIGTIMASRKAVWSNSPRDTETLVGRLPEDRPLHDVDSRTLARVLVARARRRLRIRFRARVSR